MAGLRRRMGGADLAAVPEVRHALRELLRHWQERDCAEVAELLISELVTNALVHTERGAVVTATVADSRLRVEVRDFAAPPAGPPLAPVRAADDATHGRGLALVRSLADDWGIRTRPLGKVVWFEMNGEAAA
ncbi:ATP-binding protein [Streptomyces sp. NPDC087420]|uniref:ATP-binding protein n=1 Tax=unclassified Streptomyces TaxID=2593676 RepID=UPI002E11100F|nr:ATP-binding protein [Streptomyces sp. NBC_01317]